MDNDHAVGDQEVNYRPLVIGGRDGEEDLKHARYRGDSFICGSGIHAGFIKNSAGGCGALRLTGEASHFPSSKRHGIESVGFDSDFPLSFTFIEGSHAKCEDLRWPLLGVTLTFTILISLFTTSPAWTKWSSAWPMSPFLTTQRGGLLRQSYSSTHGCQISTPGQGRRSSAPMVRRLRIYRASKSSTNQFGRPRHASMIGHRGTPDAFLAFKLGSTSAALCGLVHVLARDGAAT